MRKIHLSVEISKQKKEDYHKIDLNRFCSYESYSFVTPCFIEFSTSRAGFQFSLVTHKCTKFIITSLQVSLI